MNKKNNFIHAIFCVLPFLFIQFVNYYVLGRRPHNIEFDLDYGFFGLALNDFTGHMLSGFQHPSYTIIEICGFIIKYFTTVNLSHPEVMLNRYAAVGSFFNTLTILVLGYWISKILLSFGIGRLKAFTFVSTIAVMPAMAILSTNFCPYYLLSFLLVPAALSLYEYFYLNRYNPVRLGLSSIIFGFVVANYFLMLAIGIFAAFATASKFILKPEANQFSFLDRKGKFAALTISFLIVISWIALFEPSDFLPNIRLSFAALALAGLILFTLKRDLVKRYFRNVLSIGCILVAPFLFGMILGANKYSHLYFETLSFVRNTYYSAPGNFKNFFIKLFAMNIWHVLLLISTAWLLVLCWNFFKKKQRAQIIPTLLFLAPSTLISAYGIFNYYSADGMDSRFGGESRFILWCMPLVIFFMMALLQSSKQIFQRILAAFAVVCFLQYTLTLYNRARDVDTFMSRVDAKIEEFWSNTSEGIVVCVNDEAQSKYCTNAYAYNKYRSDDSEKAFPTNWLYDNRLYWHGNRFFDKNIISQLGKEYKDILLVGYTYRLTDNLRNIAGYSKETIFSNDFKNELDTLGANVEIIHFKKND